MTILQQRPVRALGMALAVSALLSGCGVVEGRAFPVPADAAPTGTAAPTGSPTVPADRFPEVLSTTTADTGTPATVDELTALQVVDELEKPPGFVGVTVVVGSGRGSYRVATPRGWSAPWRVGTPYDDVYRAAQPLDPAWAAEFRSIAESADTAGTLRSVAVDAAATDGVTALIVTLTGPDPASGDALAEQAAGEFEKIGNPVQARHGVRVNGADGAYIEFTRPTEEADRAAVQVRIPDRPNGLLWGLTCEGPEDTRDELRTTCAQIAATFRPLPTVIG